MEGGVLVLQRLYFEIGDRGPTHVGHAHAEHERVHQIPDDDIPPLHALGSKPVIGVQRVMIHRDHAKEVIISFRDRLSRPVSVHVTDDEFLEASTKGAFVNGHLSDASR